jgi:hypothetical protein
VAEESASTKDSALAEIFRVSSQRSMHRNPKFSGRTSLLDHIYNELASGLEDQIHVVVLVGVGGVGKNPNCK